MEARHCGLVSVPTHSRRCVGSRDGQPLLLVKMLIVSVSELAR